MNRATPSVSAYLRLSTGTTPATNAAPAARRRHCVQVVRRDPRTLVVLITTDSGMLSQARELAVVRQTNLSLVVARDAGHDPIKATGLLFTHLAWICRETSPDRPQILDLAARNRPGVDPLTFFEKIARHTHKNADEVWREGRLTPAELARDPLAL